MGLLTIKNISHQFEQLYLNGTDDAGYGHYRTVATPLCQLRMCITRGAAEACTSCPV